ncbi:hypothetical protein SBFV3_gp35 [Sulfolobales Beppu filamentous virus 3]|uniref:Uncharacterized protein n=1 Tax=Sulfolobales Beppu filamentous virus 3 TaxID=2493124 RepID=A0A3Q8Q3V6_9VIRU|nr:hypothetical protein HOU83_gp35 [Sulfolobales Beppu filamentous virus 3]AZI75870.1 hypothetical protein SBFV3_gp35 [Sulfolobales Beppu filamentous virus 3]
MTLSVQYLSAVSTAIVLGVNTNNTVTYYYYYSSAYSSTQLTVSTLPPTGIVAVLKNDGVIVTKLDGIVNSVTVNNGNTPNGSPSSATVSVVFVDSSPSSYTFNEVEIYTVINGTLYNSISYQYVGTVSKSSSEIVTVNYELQISNAPSYYVTFCFLYLLVPNLQQYNVFPFNTYPGIATYSLSGVSGSVSFVSFIITQDSFEVLLTITTTGGGYATINAYTTPFIQGAVTPQPTSAELVFSATLPVTLPQTNTPTSYPVAVGIEYEV